ncbi:flagellar hook-length control protein FliK [Bosea minatitlanensis]|uniref:Flagellar hook-length control protein FliK n=1 Tax=Bosea minatitlanensis TaxID=128782 RepID=A0ABW0F1D5_9HYPH|nr:flagellar hook-length control protein FliK [Bosea minatitlanensis]MCT4492054.1 flagellar hook-length control protein FliK [Bosea minatitlanensis]
MNLAQLVQSQNLARLMQALDAAGEPAAGRTVQARLLSLESDGTATAAIGDARITLVLAGPQAKQAALQPGATLVLHLEAPDKPGGDLRATLVETRPPADMPEPPQTRPAGQSPALAQPPVASGSASAPPANAPAAGRMPVQAQPPASSAGAALPDPAMTAAPGQAAPVGTPPSAAPPGPLAPPTAPAAAHPAEAGQSAMPAPASPRAAIGPTLGAALTRQDSLAPLFANLRGLAEGTVALTLPKPLLGAIDQVLRQSFPAESRTMTGPRLQEALRSSGLFLEAHLAGGRPAVPGSDLKAGLLALRETLLSLVDTLSPSAPANRTERPALPADAAVSAPAAPRRDGPLAAQPVAEPTLAPGEKPLAIAATLLGQTEAALDRIKLAQYASLPPDAPRLDPAQQQPQRWLAEIPLAFQHGTAVLPLHVEKDPPRHEAPGGSPPLWRVRFALDVEPMGPLQGVVTLCGREVGVTLWAEREETSQLLRGAAPGLENALLDADFTAGSIDIHTGQPRVMQPTAGQFLDRLS